MTPNMLSSLLTTLVAAGVCAAAVAPFALEWLLTRRGSSRLRLAEQRIEEHQAGFVHGVGPVRRATPWDVLEAQVRVACTAWRAAVISRPRNCREREARRALRQILQAPVRRHPRHCAHRVPPAHWWPVTPPARRTPKGITPLQAVIAELRGMAS